MHKRFLGIIWLLLLLVNAYGQKGPKSIELGQSVPEEFYRSLQGCGKGKLIILDFWNIWCKACIEAMPKMQELQAKFDGQLEIVLVTSNSKEEANNLFRKLRVSPPDVKMLFSDSIFKEYFPHEAEPFHVWIDESGKVIYRTEAQYATKQNIASVIKGQRPEFPERIEWATLNFKGKGMSLREPIFYQFVPSYSIWLEGLSEVTRQGGFKIAVDSVTGRVNYIQAINLTIWRLIRIAYDRDIPGFNTSYDGLNNRVIMDSFARRYLLRPNDSNELTAWWHKSAVSYELRLSSKTTVDAFEVMKRDLNLYSDFEIAIEKKELICLALVLKGDKLYSLVETDTSRPAGYKWDKNIEIENRDLQSTLVKSLTRRFSQLETPIIDQTGFHHKITVSMAKLPSELTGINSELEKIGLELTEKHLFIPMVVIRMKERRAYGD